MTGANEYRTLSEAEAAKWALIFPLDDVPGDLSEVEAGYFADQLETLWFADMRANRPHVIRGRSAESVAGFRDMCRAALRARILARQVTS